MLTRGAEIETLTKSPHFSSRRAQELLGSLGLLEEDAASKDMLATWSRLMFFQDPPRHTQLRQLIMKGFTPAAVERFRPQLAAIVERVLEKGRRQGEMDVVADFAEPIALTTIAEMFALPQADRPQFTHWAKDLLKPAGGSPAGALLTLPRWEFSGEPYNYQGSNFQDRGPSSLHVRFPSH